MKTKFNHAANESPRSGSDKATSPVIWGVVVIAFLVVGLWLTMHA